MDAFKRYTLYVFDTYEEALQKEKEIVNESLKSAAIGTAMSSMTAWMNYTVKSAVDTQAMGLMPELTMGFGEMMKGFFGAADDTLVYIFCE